MEEAIHNSCVAPARHNAEHLSSWRAGASQPGTAQEREQRLRQLSDNLQLRKPHPKTGLQLLYDERSETGASTTPAAQVSSRDCT